MNPGILKSIGVYGYDKVEPLVLAALVTEDPLLLIGKAGTGKTYLLNSLSEALGLEHRHYNASLIAFDDLVGFPYPEENGQSIRYIQTPATVWQAESVLVDEISRCKPEHQNRLFSLVHERRIQGLPLERLRYRWAAMNPCGTDQGVGDSYDGSLPLDQALADRFALILEVPEWKELSDQERALVADPRGEGVLSIDTVGLRSEVEAARGVFLDLVEQAPPAFIKYAAAAATVLGNSRVRISPRRVRQLVKNLYAVASLRGGAVKEADFLLTLTWSLPHRAWGVSPDREVIAAAHRTAWDSAFSSCHEAWLNGLMLQSSLPRKVEKILKETPDPDTGTLAVTQTLGHCTPENRAAFAFCLYPVAMGGHLRIGREGIQELGKVAKEILSVDGEIKWQERLSRTNTQHPEYSRVAKVLAPRRGKRRERARQLFYHLLVNNVVVNNPKAYEEEFNECIMLVQSHLRGK